MLASLLVLLALLVPTGPVQEPVDPAALLLGDVVDVEGRPVAGLAVAAVELAPEHGAKSPARLTAMTHADGRFVFERGRRGCRYALELRATRDGTPWTAAREHVLEPGAPPVAVVELRLPPPERPAKLEVTVRTPTASARGRSPARPCA